ncbi:MAG: type II toxin-antitoxin system RelE/ParE family toxin [Gemmatimonadales bacterium]
MTAVNVLDQIGPFMEPAQAEWTEVDVPLAANRRAEVRDALERHLRHAPTKVSKSRIKRLRGLIRPQYRLRIDDLRVCYDVTEGQVEVLAIVPKEQARDWLFEQGTPDEASRPGEGEG